MLSMRETHSENGAIPLKMLYMTVWAIKHRTFVNNFAYETAEINIEVKHLQPLKFYQNDEVVVDLE
ncbi:MAG: hypothetical protein II819_10835 [Fibrobacter sp.]|nr:hypothetical protein [Fibrobacter sp.]